MLYDALLSARAHPLARQDAHGFDPLMQLGGKLNLASYVSNDPINMVDPSGLRQVCWNEDASYTTEGETVVQSRRICADIPDDGGPFGGGASDGFGGTGGSQGGTDNEIVVTGERVRRPALRPWPRIGNASLHLASTTNIFGQPDDAYEEYEDDIRRCQRLSDASRREACYASAMQRYAARISGRPVPELVTWRDAATAAAIATALYWFLSVASRFLFPPRNLIPIP